MARMQTKLGNSPAAVAITAAALVLLAGCATLDPPSADEIRAQALPQVEVPAQWKMNPSASAGRIGDGWVTTFGDPQLDALVAEAIANNPDLQVAAARVEQADAAVEAAKAQLRPAIGILGRTSTKPVSDLIPVLTGVVLRAWWELDLWGRLRYERNAARAERDAAGADYRFAQQSIAASTARAWFLAAATARQQQLSDEMARNSVKLVEFAEQREKVGAGTGTDVAVARTNSATYLDAAKQVELAHRQALRALEVLLGRYPGAEIKSRQDLAAFPGPVPVGVPLEVLERRPDLIAAERRVAAAFNRTGAAKAARLPTLTLSANVGWVDTDDLEDVTSERDSTTKSAGAQVVAPIYLGGALDAQIDLRSAEQKQAVAEYGRLALRALSEVEDALDAENILGRREDILRTSLDESRRALDLERTSYRVGKADLRDVTQSQLSSFATEIALLQVRREHLDRRVDLHLALGGNFVVAPATDATGATGAGAPSGQR